MLLKYHLVGSHKYNSNENNDELGLRKRRARAESELLYLAEPKGTFFCFCIIFYMVRRTRTLTLIQYTDKRRTLPWTLHSRNSTSRTQYLSICVFGIQLEDSKKANNAIWGWFYSILVANNRETVVWVVTFEANTCRSVDNDATIGLRIGGKSERRYEAK